VQSGQCAPVKDQTPTGGNTSAGSLRVTDPLNARFNPEQSDLNLVDGVLPPVPGAVAGGTAAKCCLIFYKIMYYIHDYL
jgi:hypothetical protein